MKETRKLSELVKVIMEAGFMGTEITLEELEEIGFDIGWFFNYEDYEAPERVEITCIDAREAIAYNADYEPIETKKAIRVEVKLDWKEAYMGTDEGYICEDNAGALEDFFLLCIEWLEMNGDEIE